MFYAFIYIYIYRLTYRVLVVPSIIDLFGCLFFLPLNVGPEIWIGRRNKSRSKFAIRHKVILDQACFRCPLHCGMVTTRIHT